MANATIRVADIIGQDPRLTPPALLVPQHVVEDSKQLHRGAVGEEAELVGRQDTLPDKLGLVVVLEEGGDDLPHGDR